MLTSKLLVSYSLKKKGLPLTFSKEQLKLASNICLTPSNYTLTGSTFTQNNIFYNSHATGNFERVYICFVNSTLHHCSRWSIAKLIIYKIACCYTIEKITRLANIITFSPWLDGCSFPPFPLPVSPYPTVRLHIYYCMYELATF